MKLDFDGLTILLIILVVVISYRMYKNSDTFQLKCIVFRRQTAEEREQERQAATKYFLSMQLGSLPPPPPPHQAVAAAMAAAAASTAQPPPPHLALRDSLVEGQDPASRGFEIRGDAERENIGNAGNGNGSALTALESLRPWSAHLAANDDSSSSSQA